MPPFENDILTTHRQPAHQTDNQVDKNHPFIRLSYIALIPFGFGALCIWLSPWVLPVSRALIIQQGTVFYAAIIASYLAGMDAGNALTRGRQSFTAYLPSAIASVVAWLAVIPRGYFFISIQPAWQVLIVILVFCWLTFRDTILNAHGKWYSRSRFRLSAWVVIALMAILARLILWHQY